MILLRAVGNDAPDRGWVLDTSAWIEYLRRTGSPANLLAGATSGHASAQLEKLTSGLQVVPVQAALDYRDAAIAYRAVRARGGTVRTALGCLVISTSWLPRSRISACGHCCSAERSPSEPSRAWRKD